MKILKFESVQISNSIQECYCFIDQSIMDIKNICGSICGYASNFPGLTVGIFSDESKYLVEANIEAIQTLLNRYSELKQQIKIVQNWILKLKATGLYENSEAA